METEDRPTRGPALPMRLLLVTLVLSGSVGCDRATKLVAESTLQGSGRISLFHDLFRLEYVRNAGAFLSLGSRLTEPARSVLLVGGVAGLVLALLVLALGRRRAGWQVVALALVAGGGLGNLWDRLASGAVADFMNLGVGPVRTGIFNVADLAIVAGVAMLVARRRPLTGAGPPQRRA
jgi:signal peptidase II